MPESTFPLGLGLGVLSKLMYLNQTLIIDRAIFSILELRRGDVEGSLAMRLGNYMQTISVYDVGEETLSEQP